MIRLICPKCKGKAVVTRTVSKDEELETVRYHLCKECGNKFTTSERMPDGWKYESKYKELIKSHKKLIQDSEGK